MVATTCVIGVGKVYFPGLKNNHYGMIYLDPASRFATWSDKGRGRSAENHYDTMTFDKMRELPVVDLALDDCVMLMWTSGPFVPHHLELMQDYGFIYKTIAFYWLKTTRNNGPLHMGL